ncbi:MAG: glycerate kinase type-2 family protein [Planctomycetota bacterium]
MPAVITNYHELASTPSRKLALDIYLAGLRSVMPGEVIPRPLRREGRQLFAGESAYDLSQGRLFVIGGGKAAGAMAQVVERIVGPSNIAAGVVVDKTAGARTGKIKILTGGHPVPTGEGVAAVREMLDLVGGLSGEDVVICLFSGGGSALMTCPPQGVTLENLQQVNRRLLLSGAAIHEINIVRKHLSAISGGRLARLLRPARVVVLVISDIPGADHDAVASGPACPDLSTYAMALDVIRAYGLLETAPRGVVDHLVRGGRGDLPETPKPGDPVFESVQRMVIATNAAALDAMRDFAVGRGCRARVMSPALTGDVRAVAGALASEIRKERAGPEAGCLLAGGEPTVAVAGSGRGGRCQELAARMIEHVSRTDVCAFLAAGTDGSDYLPGVAGGLIDGDTRRLAEQRSVDLQGLLADNDSHAVHAALDTLVLTRPTGTNVCDLFVHVLDGRRPT